MKSFLFVAAAAYSQLLCGFLGKYLLEHDDFLKIISQGRVATLR